MRWKQQPPARSPVPAPALLRAATAAVGDPHGARRRLAERLRERFSRDHVILTDRGTTALVLALRAAAAEGRDVAALPAFGCYDLATAVAGAGVRVALYDLDPATLGPDPASLEKALRAGASTIVVAMPFGLAPDWAGLAATAARYGATLIEDAAQGHGASLGDLPLGALGDSAVISFGRGKGWTGGGGGALLGRGTSPVNEDLVAGAAASVKTLAGAAMLAAAARPTLYRIPSSIPWLGLGETRYREPSPPAGIPAAAAALALASEAAADREAANRRALGDWLARALAELGHETTTVVREARPGWLRFPVRVQPGHRSDVLRRGRDLGLAATWPGTLADLPAIRGRRVDQGELPGATALVAELITAPTHGGITDVEAERIVSLLHGRIRLEREAPFGR